MKAINYYYISNHSHSRNKAFNFEQLSVSRIINSIRTMTHAIS